MSNFVYDNEAIVAGKDNLSLRPTVPANKKIVAAEWNTLAAAMTDLSNATKAGVFHGLVGGASPAVAPTGETRLKSGAAGLEVSFSGGAYAPVGGTVADVSGTVAGKVNLVDQVLGHGVKTVDALTLPGGLSPAVAPSGATSLKGGAAGLEVSFSGGAYAPVGGSVTVGSFGSTPDARGASSSGSTLTMQPCDGTHPGEVSLADQVMGQGVKTFPSAVGLVSAPSAAVSGAGEVRFRSNAGSPEVSANGGAYTTLATGTGTLDTPQACTSSANHIALSFAAHCNYYHTTTENTTLDAPTNALAGMSGCIEIEQGATARTVAFASFWKFSGGIVPTVTPTALAKDHLFFYIGHDNTQATCRLVGNVS